MSSKPSAQPKETTTLREIMKSYLPEAEQVNENTHAGVKFLRNLAKHVRDQNADILDAEFDADQTQEVSRGIFDFVNGSFKDAMRQAEQGGKILTEADLVRLIPDNIGRLLADDVRERIFDALQKSTSSINL